MTQCVRPSTYQSYAFHMNHYLKPALGRRQLTELSPQDVQALMQEQLAAGLSPRTVQYMRAVLRSALNQALRWGMVTRNVATLVDPPRSRRPKVNPLTPVQARQLVQAIKGHQLETLITFALSLGLRKGEILGLRWNDLDLETGTLQVRHAIQKVNGTWQFVEPKTDQSRRTLHLPPITLAALRQHRERQALERAAAGSRWQEWNLVFPSAVGTPMDGSNLTH